MGAADSALYDAKRRGRNCSVAASLPESALKGEPLSQARA
jgi:hypothetical protein